MSHWGDEHAGCLNEAEAVIPGNGYKGFQALPPPASWWFQNGQFRRGAQEPDFLTAQPGLGRCGLGGSEMSHQSPLFHYKNVGIAPAPATHGGQSGDGQGTPQGLGTWEAAGRHRDCACLGPGLIIQAG